MLISFLFWNLKSRRLQNHLARMVSLHQVDVVMLAECEIAANELENELRQSTGQPYYFSDSMRDPATPEEKIKLITRFQQELIPAQFDEPSGRLTIRRLVLLGVPETLLAVVHLASLTNYDNDDLADFVQLIAQDIRKVEQDTGISRTILVGDFNMNPFHRGVVSARGFHGVMTKDRARLEARTVQFREYRFFYNPMWGFFGDRTAGPAGTFHRSSSDPLNYFWNIFDQVLLRPELMDGLRVLQILDTDGVESLLKADSTPNARHLSDHLPLFFQLEM